MKNGAACTMETSIPDNVAPDSVVIQSSIAEALGYALVCPPPTPETCQYCGNTLYYSGLISPWRERGKLKVFMWFTEPQLCDCEKAAKARAEQKAERERKKAESDRKQREEEQRKRIANAIGNSGIKPRFLSRKFENFITDTPGRKKAHQAAMDYVCDFAANREAGQGLYILGSFGTGKTHLAVAIALELLETGYRVIFRTADDLFRDIKRTFGEGDAAEQKILAQYKTCDLLVIDDLGKEQATEWTTAMLYAIINERYEAQRPVIITTNFSERELIAIESPKGTGKQRINAILSRLHETTTALEMAWEDWRRK